VSAPNNEHALILKNARENNLKNLTVRFPLGLLVGVSGVSGSGKSTLVHKTLYTGWLRLAGRPAEVPGLNDGMEGLEHVEEMVLVDQQPVGRTPRANLLTYTKVLDPLRKILAETPEARACGYSPRHFSFNVAGGRCEHCKGEGFERVEMQFLADVTIPCPKCGGRRFKEEILEVRARGLSIGDMLDCTAGELLERFGDEPAVVKALEPVLAMGLDYLRLGQPLSSFSGGEAQRVKLIRHLAVPENRKSANRGGPACSPENRKSAPPKGKMFILDEPTTGLHPHDLRKLLDVLKRLADLGHTVLMVEHNLDALAACDWILDLGPEGGEGGGRLVAQGPPEAIAQQPESHTGRFLKQYMEKAGFPESPDPDNPDTASQAPPPLAPSAMDEHIVVRGAYEHNLRLEEIRLPRSEMIVVTGLSGSGKSTLAFDVLFAEGQRRYLECLSNYVRQYFKILEKPRVDQILGIPPTVAIEQRASRLGRRSTVGTITEIHHFLRLLFSKLGRQHCPRCGRPLEALDHDRILGLAQRELAETGSPRVLWAPLVRGRKGIYRELFLRLGKMGFRRARVDGKALPLDPLPVLDRYREHDIEVEAGRLDPSSESPFSLGHLDDLIRRALSLGGGTFSLEDPTGESPPRIYSRHLYCSSCRSGLAPLDPRLFSFNSRHGSCPRCAGLGIVHDLDIQRLMGPADLSLEDGLLKFLRATPLFRSLARTLALRWREHLGLSPDARFHDLDEKTRQAILQGVKGKVPGLLESLEASSRKKRSEDDGNDPDPLGNGRPQGPLKGFYEPRPCPRCNGERLNEQARHVFFKGWSLGGLGRLTVEELEDVWKSLEFDEFEAPVATPVSREVLERLFFLKQVGLDYLQLDRSGETLSGGEAQRIRLAAQLGSNLMGACYILDEPTIGLHPVDNRKLLESLRRLKEKGNTIVVVEHDLETMREADRIVELGPGAGKEGGRLVGEGPFSKLCATPGTLTHHWLSQDCQVPFLDAGRESDFSDHPWLEMDGVSARNLKNLEVRLPLRALVCVTGVSGSGKTTLVREVLYRALKERLGRKATAAPSDPGGLYRRLRGHEALSRVLEVDHNPIGRTPRSTPATYVGIWDRVRKLFAGLPEARQRGLSPSRFSFNVKGGRCEACQGQGRVRVEMNFLPDVYVPCEACGGRRFNEETLAARFKGATIADVLDMTVKEAGEAFRAFPSIATPLKVLEELGLGYLALGQPSPTLSGGEAQRIKLAGELGHHRPLPRPAKGHPDENGSHGVKGGALYLLDEPTTGLHRADTAKLLKVLRALVDRGDTVLVIEHNPDFIAAADYVLDLGPGSAEKGGRIVAQGTPHEIARREESATGRALRDFFPSESTPERIPGCPSPAERCDCPDRDPRR